MQQRDSRTDGCAHPRLVRASSTSAVSTPRRCLEPILVSLHSCSRDPPYGFSQLTAALGILHRDCSCRPRPTSRCGSPSVGSRRWPLWLQVSGSPSRPRDCHSAAPHSAFSRCINGDGERERQQNDGLANGVALPPQWPGWQAAPGPGAGRQLRPGPGPVAHNPRRLGPFDAQRATLYTTIRGDQGHLVAGQSVLRGARTSRFGTAALPSAAHAGRSTCSPDRTRVSSQPQHGLSTGVAAVRPRRHHSRPC